MGNKASTSNFENTPKSKNNISKQKREVSNKRPKNVTGK